MDPDNSAPDRWIGCPNYGELIDDTFLPMKTLLKEDIPLPPNYRYTPDMFVQQMKEKKINVGLIINLTFSHRYYDEEVIKNEHNIEFKQIRCRGHNESPSPNQRAEFVRICNSFLGKNPKKVIAVHCTHGFNRTGFLICYFLCSERDWSIDAAVTLFASKRPPGIYKQEYINDLFEVFAENDDPIIQAAPKPAWDADDGLALDMLGGGSQETNNNNNNQREFYEGITDVTLVRDEAIIRRVYRHCCMLCNYNVDSPHLAFPGAQPVSMDQENIKYLKAQRYRVSWKADGCRYMLYIQDEDNIFFLTRSLHLWRVKGLSFPRLDNLHSHLTDTLLDGEMVTDDINGKKIPKYLIYDVISLNGNIVARNDFDKRCGQIKYIIVEARRKAKHANIIPTEGEPFKVADKGFFYIQDTKKTLNLQVTHEKDGLIYQPVDEPYTGGTCCKILKWKPPSLNSIDFRLVVREERQNGCIPESYAYLHVSNRSDAISKFRLDRDTASYHQYNNKIVEMTLNPNNGKWDILRERSDKLYANSFETASAVWKSIKQPVTEKYLLDFVATIKPEAKR